MSPLTPFARIGLAAQEMHHLLWNPDRSVRHDGVAWWNCADVAAITAGLMWLNGCQVEAWSGQVFFVQSPKSNGASPCLHLVPRHWWIAAKNIGIIDLSPDLSVTNSNWDSCSFDYVFGNKVAAKEMWSFHQANNMETVEKKLRPLRVRRDQFACIYLRENSKTFTGDGILTDGIVANQNRDPKATPPLLLHLDKVLRGEAEPLTHLSQADAWRAIYDVSELELKAFAARFC